MGGFQYLEMRDNFEEDACHNLCIAFAVLFALHLFGPGLFFFGGGQGGGEGFDMFSSYIFFPLIL